MRVPEHFEGDWPANCRIMGAIYRTESTTAEFGVNPIFANRWKHVPAPPGRFGTRRLRAVGLLLPRSLNSPPSPEMRDGQRKRGNRRINDFVFARSDFEVGESHGDPNSGTNGTREALMGFDGNPVS